jgi:hypothetical protein
MTAGTATGQRESAWADLRARSTRWPRSPIFYGIVVAVVAAVAGQWVINPPAAYGLCSACHGRDLENWIINEVYGKQLFVTAAGSNWPLFTVVGVVLGSMAAARRNGELKAVDIGGHLNQFVLGGVVMCAALFVGGCPTRIIIRTGYGDVAAALTLGGIAAGIVAATLSMRWWARR